MEEKKKIFTVPEAEIIDFCDNDIITISTGEENANWWDGNGDNNEDF